MLSTLLNEYMARRFTVWTKLRYDCTKKKNFERLDGIVTGLGFFEIENEYDIDSLADS